MHAAERRYSQNSARSHIFCICPSRSSIKNVCWSSQINVCRRKTSFSNILPNISLLGKCSFLILHFLLISAHCFIKLLLSYLFCLILHFLLISAHCFIKLLLSYVFFHSLKEKTFMSQQWSVWDKAGKTKLIKC